MGCHTKHILEKRDGAFIFKKKDLEIGLGHGTRYITPEKDVCLYKIPYRVCQGEKGEEFYMHNTKNHGRKYYISTNINPLTHVPEKVLEYI